MPGHYRSSSRKPRGRSSVPKRGSGRKPRGAARKSTGTSTMAQRRAKARKAVPSRGSGRKPQGAGREATGTKRGSGRKPGGVGPAKRAAGAAKRGSGRRPQGVGRTVPKKDTRTKGGQGGAKGAVDQMAFQRFVSMTPEQQRHVIRMADGHHRRKTR